MGAVKSHAAPPLLRVRNWDQLYENNRSRELTRTEWFPAPNDLSADGYVELVSHQDGAAHLGVWLALLMVASRAKPRGVLRRDDAQPHTSLSLARVTRIPESTITIALQRLLEIGLLENSANKPPKKNNLPPHPGAGNPQAAATTPQEGAAEGKGIEHHHHQEQRSNRKKGTERARDLLTPEHPGATRNPSFPLKGPDDDESPAALYASPDDELKAIYEAKTGERITIELLDAIRVNLELTGVDMNEFVEEAKKHSQNKWRNPPGFLRDLSVRYRAKTRRADAPVTAAEAAARNYCCATCGSRILGEGAVMIDNKIMPCACANGEWIAKQRERGVFADEANQ